MHTHDPKPHVYAAVLDTKEAVFFWVASSDNEAIWRGHVLLALEKRRGKIGKAAFDNWGILDDEGAKKLLNFVIELDEDDQFIWAPMRSILEKHPNVYVRAYSGKTDLEFGAVPQWPELIDEIVEHFPDFILPDGSRFADRSTKKTKRKKPA